MDEFRLWSELNPESIKALKPDLGLRSWDILNQEEKQKIWTMLEHKDWLIPSEYIYSTIEKLNDKYKYHSYGERLLKHGGPHRDGPFRSQCCLSATMADFEAIFKGMNKIVWYETLSLFARELMLQNSIHFSDLEDNSISSNVWDKIEYMVFENFCVDFNCICTDFGLDIQLSRLGIIPRQDDKITEEIYKPVIMILSNPKWEKVNTELNEAFTYYLQKTPTGYSGTITHGVNAIQAFLQIIVNGKTGIGDISKLIPQAQSKGLIPDDQFTTKIFKDLESFIMSERQETGNAHPKKEFATEKNARLLLNLVMVFLQHCIQN
jgi:hypothetical protein